MSPCILYPAIDLLGGRCVRLIRGDFEQVTVFDDDPTHVAARWRDEGAEWLHVVDLDGAREGSVRHIETLRAIVETTGLKVQFGGGLRDAASVEAAFDVGAQRVILGTAAVQDRAMTQELIARWGERVAVSVDARGGHITIAGWLQSVSETALDFAQAMSDLGVARLIVTSVDRDGSLAGADDSLMRELREALPAIGLTAAGGVASIDDVRRLARLGIDGVILGRALYTGDIVLPEALRVVREMDVPSQSDATTTSPTSPTSPASPGETEESAC